MALFSERYGYVKPREAFIKEKMPEEIQNAICSGYDELRRQIEYGRGYGSDETYESLEMYVWTMFLNQRKDKFGRRYDLIQNYIMDKNNPWYKKLDLLEFTLIYITSDAVKRDIGINTVNYFIELLNMHFKRLHYGYYIIENKVTPITSEEEIAAIEEAITKNKDNVRKHLQNALNLFAKRPEADYRNSIKESISAVEAYCREQTGENSLGKALSKMQKSSSAIPAVLKSAFEGLYTYTNNETTGIRHALMDDSGTYTPTSAEAQFMLVSCSAFLNYLKTKSNKIKNESTLVYKYTILL